MLPRKSQSGAAAIAAILLAALVATIGATLLFSQQSWIAQMEHHGDRLRARELAHVGTHWARAILFDDARRGRGDDLGEIWAQNMQPIQMEGATISGHIEDAQGRFDLNSLAANGKRSAGSIVAYSRLLGILGLPTELAQALADWEDADDETAGTGGAENYYYLALPDPYRCANASLVAVDELASVRGYDAAAIDRLRPFVTVLPERASVNINTASPEVLAAVTGMSLAAAQQFAAARSGRPLKSDTELAVRFAVAGPGTLDIGSRFFLISGTVKKNATRVRLETLVNRNTSDWPKIVWMRQY